MTELPPRWTCATVGELAQTVRGLTYKRGQAEAQAGRGLIPLLRATNIQNGSLLLEDDLIFVPERLIRDEQWVQPGDIVLASSSGSASVVGKSAPLLHPWRGTFGAFCTVLRPRKQVDARFLGHFVASPGVRARWSGLAAGTNINNLKTAHVAETEVPVPPLNEQRRIVAAIEEQLSRLDAAGASLRRAKLGVSTLTDVIYSDASPETSPRIELAELLREPLRNGHSAKASADGSGVRTLTLTAITNREFSDKNTKLTVADPAHVKNLWLEPGDILIERSNTPELVGTAALFRGPKKWAIFPDLLIRVRVSEEILAEFLALFLNTRTARTYFRGAAQGIAGSMPKIDQGTVERLSVPLPAIEEQSFIVSRVEQHVSLVETLRNAIEAAERRSTALRRSILDCAFRGKLVPQDPNDEPAPACLSESPRNVPQPRPQVDG
jgi:type I restriction enzyme S subunit